MDAGRVARRLLLVAAFCLYLLWVILASQARAGLLLNEVLYDPPGADGDGEFVELIAAGDDSVRLADVRLEFCNGATPGDWELLWSGELALAPGALFLVGEPAVAGADVTVDLDMQNGPEALRLLAGETLLDLLGYGEGLDPSLVEAAAADDPSGLALARQPDGVDTDQNALDWFPATPSPGALNLPPFRAALRAVAAPWLPVAPAAPCTLAVDVANDGRDPWGAPLVLAVDGVPRGALPDLPPGQSARAAIALPGLPAGAYSLAIALLAPDGEPADTLTLPLAVGLGPLQLAEILFAPTSGGVEWVECLCREPLSGLEDFQLSDLGGTAASFRPPPLPAGARFILCPDPELLRAQWPALDPDRLLAASPWPSLANSGESDEAPGWTDGLRLDDAAGRRSDGALYRGDWVPERGWSLERLRDYPSGGLPPWAPCPTGATPLAGTSPPPAPAAGGLALTPNPFDPRRERLWLDLRGEGGALAVDIFDAAGRPVQRLEASLASGLARLVWDGRDARGRELVDGAYPLLARWQSPDGRPRALRAVAALRRSGT
ncbi:MAG: hypothetical protein R3C71_12050 [Candidatus Krumholzibacteriia bacterium]